MRTLSFISVIALFLALAPESQAESAISGVVRDPSGAAVEAAVVQLTAGGRLLLRAVTDSSGAFRFEQARPDEQLSLTVVASGFAPLHRTTVPHAHLELTLEVAPYQQSMDVNAAAGPDSAVLDVAGVRESSARDVGEALSALDGVAKIRKAGIANDVVIRGFQQNNINVLVDGSRIYGACPNHMDPAAQHVDFAEVERVEVTKGAFDVANQGSLGASVNIITRQPGTGFSFRPSLSLGSFGFVNPTLAASWGGRRVRVLGGYSYRQSAPYRDGHGRRFTEYASFKPGADIDTAFSIHTGWAETQYSISDRQSLTGGYTRQQAGVILYPYLTMDNEFDNADRATFRYSGEDLGALRRLRAEFYLTQVRHFMSDLLRRSAPIDGTWRMAGDASTRTGGGRVEAEIDKTFTAGVEAYSRNWNMTGAMRSGAMLMINPTIPDVDTHSAGVFAIWRRAITETLRLTSGVRYDHATMQATAPGLSTALFQRFHDTRKTSNADSYASGNVRLSMALSGGMEWFAGAGTTGRIPDAAERYINRSMAAMPTAGNPLLPMTRNTELAAGWSVHRQRAYVRPSLFYSFLDDLIVVNNQPAVSSSPAGAKTARSFTNVHARMYGGEIGWGVVLTSSLSLNGGGSYSKALATARPEAGVRSRNLPEMPPLRGWTTLRYTRSMFYAESGSIAVNRQSLVSTDLRESPTAGYALLNLRAGATRGRISASVALDNALDRHYYEHLSYFRDPFSAGIRVPEPGRNVFLQLRYAF